MLRSLELSNFRNLKELSLEFSGGITIISGKNGSGKSSLLEAIHIICQGFSFRTKSITEAINFDADDFILRAKTDEDEMALQADKFGTKGKLNGKEFRRASSLFGVAPLVFISPEDIELAKGSPENRRSFIDELLCFYKKSNLELLRNYRKVLKQRNKLLKEPEDEFLFDTLTEQLADLAVQVWSERKNLCEILEPHINEFYQTLCNKTESIGFSYTRAMDKESFLKKVKEKYVAEIANGSSLVGPHRDDIEIYINNHLMRNFGSQGQCRSIALSMKFAAAQIIEQYSSKPLLLLDDIFAELDHSRRNAIATIVKQKESQTFAATPSAEDLPFKGDAFFLL